MLEQHGCSQLQLGPLALFERLHSALCERLLVDLKRLYLNIWASHSLRLEAGSQAPAYPKATARQARVPCNPYRKVDLAEARLNILTAVVTSKGDESPQQGCSQNSIMCSTIAAALRDQEDALEGRSSCSSGFGRKIWISYALGCVLTSERADRDAPHLPTPTLGRTQLGPQRTHATWSSRWWIRQEISAVSEVRSSAPATECGRACTC